MAQALMAKQFQDKLQRAMERVRVVLNQTKTPQLAADVHHFYDDKYLLVEQMTCAAAASQLNCLVALGLTAEHLATLRQWASHNSVSLQFRAEERCTFLRETTRKEDSPTHHEVEFSMPRVIRAAVSSKIVTKITEYCWKLEVQYELVAVRGVGAESADRIPILSRTGHHELKTTCKLPPPSPEAKVPAVAFEVNITWLLHMLQKEVASPAFKIDRVSAECRTPRRNPDVDAAFRHFRSLTLWTAQVAGYLSSILDFVPALDRKLDLGALSAEAVFVPVLPLMMTNRTADGAQQEVEVGGLGPPSCRFAGQQPDGSLLLNASDANRLLEEELRMLTAKRKELSEAYPGADELVTFHEGFAIVTCSTVLMFVSAGQRR